MPRKYKFTLTRDLILEYLKDHGPATAKEMVPELKKCRDAVRKALDRLHEEKEVYVKDWPFVGRHRARQWALRTSTQRDMPKPEPTPMPVHYKNFQARNAALLKARRSVNAARGNPFAMLIK